MARIVLFTLLLVFAGCATISEGSLPPCPRPQVISVQLRDGSPGVLFDMEAVKVLMARMKGLWDRTCQPEESNK